MGAIILTGLLGIGSWYLLRTRPTEVSQEQLTQQSPSPNSPSRENNEAPTDWKVYSIPDPLMGTQPWLRIAYPEEISLKESTPCRDSYAGALLHDPCIVTFRFDTAIPTESADFTIASGGFRDSAEAGRLGQDFDAKKLAEAASAVFENPVKIEEIDLAGRKAFKVEQAAENYTVLAIYFNTQFSFRGITENMWVAIGTWTTNDAQRQTFNTMLSTFRVVEDENEL